MAIATGDVAVGVSLIVGAVVSAGDVEEAAVPVSTLALAVVPDHCG